MLLNVSSPTLPYSSSFKTSHMNIAFNGDLVVCLILWFHLRIGIAWTQCYVLFPEHCGGLHMNVLRLPAHAHGEKRIIEWKT